MHQRTFWHAYFLKSYKGSLNKIAAHSRHVLLHQIKIQKENSSTLVIVLLFSGTAVRAYDHWKSALMYFSQSKISQSVLQNKIISLFCWKSVDFRSKDLLGDKITACLLKCRRQKTWIAFLSLVNFVYMLLNMFPSVLFHFVSVTPLYALLSDHVVLYLNICTGVWNREIRASSSSSKYVLAGSCRWNGQNPVVLLKRVVGPF